MMLIDPDAQIALFERHKRALLNALPYGLLAISLLVTIAAHASRHLLLTSGLTLLAAGWLLLTATLHPQWLERPLTLTIFFVGILVIAAALVLTSGWYGIFAWSGYVFSALAFTNLRARAAGVAATALLLGTAQHGGVPSGSLGSWISWSTIVLANFVIAGGMIWAASVDDLRHDRRDSALQEITEVNKRLEASLEENAALHRQLVAQAREAGVLDERQRMAREIHDTLAQGLTGIITQLAAATQAREESAEREHHLAAAAELARESLREARRSVAAMTPEALRDSKLPDALRDVAARWSELHHVPAQVTSTGAAQPLRPEIEVALLRTAQEALANIAKHAHASRVGVTLSYMGDVVTLDVRDDGIGFPSERANRVAGERGGFGLTAMRQRALALGGTLEIESEIGSGTAVCASIPAIAMAAPGSAGDSLAPAVQEGLAHGTPSLA
jgi:signal transduction histidine kinase